MKLQEVSTPMSNSRIHRFYIGNKSSHEIQNFGEQHAWLRDRNLIHQWTKVLRFRASDKISLFDNTAEFIYSIVEFKPDEITLNKVTKEVRKISKQQLLLAWSLLKKDNNNLILQKATEIGITHFVPLIADRSEKTGFDIDRATRIVIEAVEQCGRLDVPVIDNITTVDEAVSRYGGHYQLFVANMGGQEIESHSTPTGIFIGPEGGWSDREIEIFMEKQIRAVGLSSQTLRAETAAIVACCAIQYSNGVAKNREL